MKLLVKKLWFRGSVDEVMSAFFKIPQVREQFAEGYSYDGEMRPRGIKIFSGYWPAKEIISRLPRFEEDISLVLTSMDLKGDFGRIYGRGEDRRAIASNDGYRGGLRKEIFNPNDSHFNGMIFGEIGHALGLEHHKHDQSAPCEMSHNCYPNADWKSLEEIRFCDNCYKKLRV